MMKNRHFKQLDDFIHNYKTIYILYYQDVSVFHNAAILSDYRVARQDYVKAQRSLSFGLFFLSQS